MNKKLSAKLEKVKEKNAKEWVKFNDKKEKILSRRINSATKQKLIAELLEKTYKQISKNWDGYKDFKFQITGKAPFKGLTPFKTFNTINTRQKTYKLRPTADIFEIQEKLLLNTKVSYVLVILKARDKNGAIFYFSDVYNKERYESVILVDKTDIIENTLLKLSLKTDYEGYKIIDTYIRIIYEK